MKESRYTIREKITGALYLTGIVAGAAFAVWLLIKILWLGYYAGFKM